MIYKEPSSEPRVARRQLQLSAPSLSLVIGNKETSQNPWACTRIHLAFLESLTFRGSLLLSWNLLDISIFQIRSFIQNIHKKKKRKNVQTKKNIAFTKSNNLKKINILLKITFVNGNSGLLLNVIFEILVTELGLQDALQHFHLLLAIRPFSKTLRYRMPVILVSLSTGLHMRQYGNVSARTRTTWHTSRASATRG